jgi:hypothetical protein
MAPGAWASGITFAYRPGAEGGIEERHMRLCTPARHAWSFVPMTRLRLLGPREAPDDPVSVDLACRFSRWTELTT